ncbi:acyltransferase family protein [Pseudoxanthomonas putridarboris]|uniref:acyltransferase family protein n=1 Tax=Pseudoxanthomonas putridarboris TaxID=752605 RepID=UPI003CE49821
MPNPQSRIPAPRRFASVDALRGITVAAMLLVNTPGDWSHVYAPLLHAEWHGCTPTDLVFPFFLFVVGVSIALGIVPRVEAGASRTALARAVGWRAAKIVALGLALHLLAFWLLDKPWFRPWGVLQRIGVCFAVAGMVAIHAKPRVQWAAIVALLLGYWALLAPGGYAPFANLASRLDTALIGPMVYQWDAASGRGHDPEGLLSTLPAIATTLLGLRAGAWLRAGALKPLLAGGVSCIALGLLWAQLMPINKNLWTSSYALFTSGCAMLALLLCHVAIDRRGWPALGRRFGVNAIAAYVGSAAMVVVLAGFGWMEPVYRHGFANWMTPRFGPYPPSLAFAVSFVLLWWAIVAWMDRRGWYLKV